MCVKWRRRWHMEGFLLWSVLSLPRGHQGSASWTNPLLPCLEGPQGCSRRSRGRGLPSRNWAWHFSDVFVRQGRFSMLMWRVREKVGQDDLTTGWLVNMWNSCTVPRAVKRSCQVWTSTHFDSLTHGCFDKHTHTHTYSVAAYLTNSSL